MSNGATDGSATRQMHIKKHTVIVHFVKAHLKGKSDIFSENQLNNDTMSSTRVQEQIWNSLNLVLTYEGSGSQNGMENTNKTT